MLRILLLNSKVDNQTIAVGNANGWINLYNLDEGKRVHRIEGINYINAKNTVWRCDL